MLTSTTHSTTLGAGPATPLLIAHGLFGSGRNWGVIAKRLSDRGPVTRVDMRNHAGSFWADSHSYPDMAADLTAVMEGPTDLLGHSMGGKAAMVAALSGAPVRRLIVADIAPVAYGHTQLHLIEAMRNVPQAALSRRSEADAALARDVDDPVVRAFLTQSLDTKAKAWRLNLDVLEREMPTILGFPEVSGRFEGPTLFLSGAASDYVRREHRETIKALFPAARFAKLPGAGHWLHAEKPREFEAAVRHFLEA
ncbi:MAG: alpha/beta fold hydrolase [Shimia sp.]